MQSGQNFPLGSCGTNGASGAFSTHGHLTATIAESNVCMHACARAVGTFASDRKMHGKLVLHGPRLCLANCGLKIISPHPCHPGCPNSNHHNLLGCLYSCACSVRPGSVSFNMSSVLIGGPPLSPPMVSTGRNKQAIIHSILVQTMKPNCGQVSWDMSMDYPPNP